MQASVIIRTVLESVRGCFYATYIRDFFPKKYRGIVENIPEASRDAQGFRPRGARTKKL